VRPASITDELGRFKSGDHRFASQAELNDMWLDIDFSDTDFEVAVARHVHRLLSGRYNGASLLNAVFGPTRRGGATMAEGTRREH
jgi:hypothetical protein